MLQKNYLQNYLQKNFKKQINFYNIYNLKNYLARIQAGTQQEKQEHCRRIIRGRDIRRAKQLKQLQTIKPELLKRNEEIIFNNYKNYKYLIERQTKLNECDKYILFKIYKNIKGNYFNNTFKISFLLTAKEIAKGSKYSTKTIQKELVKLQKMGIIGTIKYKSNNQGGQFYYFKQDIKDELKDINEKINNIEIKKQATETIENQNNSETLHEILKDVRKEQLKKREEERDLTKIDFLYVYYCNKAKVKNKIQLTLRRQELYITNINALIRQLIEERETKRATFNDLIIASNTIINELNDKTKPIKKKAIQRKLFLNTLQTIKKRERKQQLKETRQRFKKYLLKFIKSIF